MSWFRPHGPLHELQSQLLSPVLFDPTGKHNRSVPTPCRVLLCRPAAPERDRPRVFSDCFPAVTFGGRCLLWTGRPDRLFWACTRPGERTKSRCPAFCSPHAPPSPRRRRSSTLSPRHSHCSLTCRQPRASSRSDIQNANVYFSLAHRLFPKAGSEKFTVVFGKSRLLPNRLKRIRPRQPPSLPPSVVSYPSALLGLRPYLSPMPARRSLPVLRSRSAGEARGRQEGNPCHPRRSVGRNALSEGRSVGGPLPWITMTRCSAPSSSLISPLGR